MSKICQINQPEGLGDILFCQKIAHRALTEFGCEKVIWNVSPIYSYLKDYLIHENVFFEPSSHQVSHSEEIINNDELLYIPLLTSDRKSNYPDNRAHGHIKYKFFFDTNFLDWKNYFEIKRNLERENELINRLGININEPYNFINPCYGTPPNFRKNDKISPKNDYPNISLEIIPDVHIFDWLTIIENAKEIHTMETSLYYLIEKLSIEDNVFIYSKYSYQNGSIDDYSYMKSHCSPKWNYM